MHTVAHVFGVRTSDRVSESLVPTPSAELREEVDAQRLLDPKGDTTEAWELKAGWRLAASPSARRWSAAGLSRDELVQSYFLARRM